MAEGEKKRAINRLKTMYPLRALVDGMYERAVEASKEGRPVAWCMVGQPRLTWRSLMLMVFLPICAATPETVSATRHD